FKTVKKRQLLYVPGDPSGCVYHLKIGRIKLASYTPTGKEITLDILTPGSLFGEWEALEGTARESAAETLDDVVVGVVDREEFVTVLTRHPDLALQLTRLIGLRIRRCQHRLRDLMLLEVPARLARVLLEAAVSEGRPEQGDLRWRVHLTHQDMANVIGCARETVSSVVGQFRDKGLLRSDGRTLTILNRGALAGMLG
ncbi:MAG: Crp/Fnr family transcriptional regulator, partial [Nitrospirales bacterium]